MSDYLIKEQTLTDIADAIREKTRSAAKLNPEAMDEAIDNIITLAEGSNDANAVDADLLTGKTAYVNGNKITGTMANNGAVSKSITPSTSAQSYTIPAGYHNGSGKVSVAAAPTSLINGDAVAADVLSGKKFFSDSYTVKTGTMANNGAVSQTLNAGGSYTIPAGYHNGSGKITANSLASQTSATATAADIISGKTAWVNGVLITGTKVLSKQISLTGSGSASCPGGGNTWDTLKTWDCGGSFSSATISGTIRCRGGSGSTTTWTMSVTLAAGAVAEYALTEQSWWDCRLYFTGTQILFQMRYNFGNSSSTGRGSLSSCNCTALLNA